MPRSLDQLFSFCLSTLLPVTLLVLVLGNLGLDQVSNLPRGILFGTIFVTTIFHPRFSLFLVIATCTWFETQTLFHDYPNQFIFEFGVVGFLGGFLLHRHWFLLGEPKNNCDWIYHPFTLPILFAIPFAWIGFLIGIGEISSFSNEGLSSGRFLKTILTYGFDWNPRGSIVHPVSIILGYAIHLCLLYQLITFRKILGINANFLTTALLLGSLYVFGYAFLQNLSPSAYGLRYSKDFGGTFQNGNHLSFFAAIIIILNFYCLKLHSIPNLILRLVFFALALAALLLGGGRTSWVALGLTVIFGTIFFLSVFGKRLARSEFLLISGFVLFGIITGISGFFLLDSVENIVALAKGILVEPLRLASQGEFFSLLSSGGREHHLKIAFHQIIENPWLGLGLGNFFVKANVGYDLHNTFLSWINELGALSLIPILLGVFFYSKQIYLRAKPRDRLLIFSLLTFYFFSFQMDHFVSYRSLAMVVGISLLIPMLSSSGIRVQKRTFGIPFLCISLGIILGTLTLTSPHNRSFLFAQYQEEQDEKESFRWHAPIAIFSSVENQCLSLTINPLKEDQKIKLIAYEKAPDPASNFKRYFDWEAQQSRSEDYIIISGSWEQICVCSGKEPFILRAHYAKVPSFLRSFGNMDMRLLSFRTRNVHEISESQTKKCSKTFHL